MKQSTHLIFENPTPQDFTRFFEIHSDPETNLFNPLGAMSFASAEKVFQGVLTHWNEKGFGKWRVSEKSNPDYVIGFGGLAHSMYGTELRLNLGYRFDKSFWGKGYATQLAQAAIEYGFTNLGVPEIFALVRPQHFASIRVLEKCNLKLIGELDDVPGADKSLVYKIEST